jgi:hypothetical protein
MKIRSISFVLTLLVIIPLTSQVYSVQADEPPPRLRWGVDDAGSKQPLWRHPKGRELIEEFGFNFWVSHYFPHTNIDHNRKLIQERDRWCQAVNVTWVANLEGPNFVKEHIDEKGRSWYNRADGRHFFLFPDELLQEFGKCQQLWGFMYDEAAHMQNCRNKIAGLSQPWIFDPHVSSLDKAATDFTKAVASIQLHHAQFGIPLSTEHVFPVLFHGFARGGWTAGTKVLKENWSPAYIACALGAALQYDTELWITPDLWGLGGYPNHSPAEYKSALLLAYHMGADCIYTENLAYEDPNNPQGGLVRMTEADYELTDWGEVTRWFAKEYMPQHPRDFTFRDIRPRVAIVRQPDACWGQSNSWLPNMLFGHPDWPSNKTTEAWLKIWHLLTRGVIPEYSLSWHNNQLRQTMDYQVFCPLDGVVVFDHLVQRRHLHGVEVIFLTGLGVSKTSLAAIEECVAEGATCVALPHLLPERVRSVTGDAGEFQDGRGCWVATTDFLTRRVAARVAHVLPPENVIRYRFGNSIVTFQPIAGDMNRLSASVRQARD